MMMKRLLHLFSTIAEWLKRRTRPTLVESVISENEETLKRLKSSLSKYRYMESMDETLPEKALHQLNFLIQQVNSFEAILSQKFHPDELTFHRYSGAAHQLYLSSLENLQLIDSLLRQLSLLDLSNHSERVQQSQELQKNIQERLGFNERALGEFNRVSLSVSAIKTSRSLTQVNVETAAAELEDLAHRAKKYSNSQ